MPLPDAENRSDRVYTLLQNTDLENLAFATIQSTGQPIAIEEMSEDELRRLVLVNLARLSVKGEWDGLLTAGSSGGGASAYIGDIMQAGDDTFNADACATYGGSSISASTFGTNYPMCYPWVCPKTGNLQDMQIRVNAGATNTLRVGVYANHATNYPTTQIGGYADFDCSSTGVLTASPSSTIAVVQGTTYWLVYVWTSNYAGSGASPNVWYNSGSHIGWNQTVDQSPKGSIIDLNSPQNALPGTMSTSGYDTGVNKKLMCGLNWA